ncbi:transcription factor Sp8-like isoform X3 [Lineus longissimus]|uniref:transcription factor Sp8-like isoform X3 n=1 Tax=Lineus longissimus TaxID=88925 RepID=UPI002B4D86AF
MMKDSTMATPESTEEKSSPFQNMQTELHSKGAVLTKAWSDLFSFITNYQCELTVKENAVEIAEREIEVRRKQLEEMKPAMNCGNEEIEKLQDEIQLKESRLKLSQSELSAREQMLKQLQLDLSCNRELSEKLRCELLEKQSELMRNCSDLEQLKSELVIKQEQIQIKDNLLKKMQSEMMRENAELKEQLELERRTLELERRSHEQTKRILSENRGKSKSYGAGPSQSVIEIPDSPPTLDLSVEQSNYGLANIISMTEAQTSRSQSMEDIYSGIRVSLPNAESALSRMAALSSGPLSSPHTPDTAMPKHHHTQWRAESPTITSPRSKIPRQSPSLSQTLPQSDSFTPTGASNMSDVYFPLSTSQESHNQSGIDTSNSMFDTDIKMHGQISSAMPGTPSSGTSDSCQAAPVPISGPIPSGAMSPVSGFGMPFGSLQQEGPDGKTLYEVPQKVPASANVRLKCHVCGSTVSSTTNLKSHMRRHTGERPHKCPFCAKTFSAGYSLTVHVRTHTGEKPFKCSYCDKRFTQSTHRKSHMVVHFDRSPADSS